MKSYINEDVCNLTKKEARAIINKKKGMPSINKKATKLANKAIKCMTDDKLIYAKYNHRLKFPDGNIKELEAGDFFEFRVTSTIYDALTEKIDEMLNIKPSCEFFLDEIKILLDAADALFDLITIMILLDRAERLNELTYLENC